MKTSRHFKSSEAGGTFIFVLIAVLILSYIAADICFKSVQRYRYTMQSASWNESLQIAESGADRAMAALNTSSWTGWTTNTGTAAPTGVPTTSSTNYLNTAVVHATYGENSRNAAIKVTVDAPSGMSGSNGQWYRIRAVGTTGLPQAGTLGQEPGLVDSNGNKVSHTKVLRKFSFLTDNTGGLVSTPQVSRTVEILAQPGGVKPFVRALTLAKWLQMSGGGWIDSFDSSDSSKSTNGQYVWNKRQSNGNIGLLNSTGSDLRDTFVYGSLAYTGTEPANDEHVTGGTTNPFSTTVTPVSDPGSSWVANSPITTINNSNVTITGGSQSNPTRVKVSSLTVGGGKVLTLAPSAAGVDSYIEIWVTGDFTTSGSGYIFQEANVHVTYYIDGSITVSGNSFNNQTNIAANNMIYATGSNSVTVSGSGTFIGVLDAPKYNVTISGAANFSGAFIANTMTITGGASMHYDEALKNVSAGGSSGGYTVGSWYEVAQ